MRGPTDHRRRTATGSGRSDVDERRRPRPFPRSPSSRLRGAGEACAVEGRTWLTLAGPFASGARQCYECVGCRVAAWFRVLVAYE